MTELEYPFDSGLILKKRKRLKRELLATGDNRIKKKIAVLGGSTTSDITSILELFLLNVGIEPEFYECEYAQFWQDVMFENEKLYEFSPDIVYIHTSIRNFTERVSVKMSESEVSLLLESEYKRFEEMWEKLKADFGAVIIQNNFEQPYYRLLGNKDASDIHGLTNFVTRLNLKFYEYAECNQSFFINDINYLSADFGLSKWSEPKWWYMYKYSLCLDAVPTLCYNIANIIKSFLGRNKKALALDLDNTLWGGVVGDDGVDKIVIGQETAEAEAYYEFQEYIKAQKDIGVLLTAASKNDEENALAGLNHSDAALSADDFISIKANWEPKDVNIRNTADELGLLPESFVFVDDNPAERMIVSSQLGVQAPPIESVDSYIKTLDRSGFFEVTSLSDDDLKRSEMYEANAKRNIQRAKFQSYNDYLSSLEMTAEIADFKPIDLQRITQLTNKSNQFNLTTKRFTQPEIEAVFESNDYIRLCGRLRDKFGDNGIVSVVIGKINNGALDIILWLMSCRVLKRDMEYAMLDTLVKKAYDMGIKKIIGYYYPTVKNKMVATLYKDFGFDKISGDDSGNTVWSLEVSSYQPKNKVIDVKEK
ncbi:MAG: HAD-IIIC family phosphatase [Ruminococcus sp.]|nr:HAD-IIIC family phosphatase [Ruminococcus sp.]